MPTGFDYLGHDKALQQHWLKRIVAIVFDAVLIYVPIMIFVSMLSGRHFVSFGLFSGIVLFLYSSLFDYAVGGTVGKMIMQMKSVSIGGAMSMSQSLMRNVTKIFVLLLLLDWIVGLAVETRDPRQKWTDQIAHTSVIIHDHPSGA
ncbi:MAG: RDD family protein [Methanobacteriota archaeon]|nr:MAG: RDD family protein [Euryarchaeota archaeon]